MIKNMAFVCFEKEYVRKLQIFIFTKMLKKYYSISQLNCVKGDTQATNKKKRMGVVAIDYARPFTSPSRYKRISKAM